MRRGRVSVNGFGWGEKLLLLIITLTVLGWGVNGKFSQQKLLEVNKKLKMLNKPAVKSIKSEDGDIIDCVDIYKQPAFDHPALKNHTIQLRPSFNLATMEPTKTTTATNEDRLTTTIVSQLWHRSGSCPKGTVPIRRIRKRDLLRASSLERYGRKPPYMSNDAPTADNSSNVIYPNRSMSYLITQGYNYVGAKGDINVWNPSVSGSNEYSSAQIWLRNGPPNDYDSIESGWIVNPAVYGDTRTRFFSYWTDDSSVKTGCFDLMCSGFVQTGKQIALGASIDPVSSDWGPQYQITVALIKDESLSRWWLAYGENMITVGYWPNEIFSYLQHSAIMVMWGGEVYSPNIRKITPHTATKMGSGYFAELLFRSACFISHPRIVDYSGVMKFPEWISPSSDEPYCYPVRLYREGYIGEPVFYFGGPGRNNLCP